MKNEEANIDSNEENLSYLKEMESNVYFKEHYDDDALSEKYKLPIVYNIQKEDSFNEETHYSLLRELEDKWSYIERNKPIIPKRQHFDTTSSVSLKTNSRSRLQDWKTIIEESKKKYLQQKKANITPTEDFGSFVRAKCEQLEMISNKQNNNSKNRNAIIPTNLNSKSFLKQDCNDDTVSPSTPHYINNYIPIKKNSDKPVKIRLMNMTIIEDLNKKKNNFNFLNDKMKDVFYSITDANWNNNDSRINSKNNKILNDINEKELSMSRLKWSFNEIITKIIPNSPYKIINGLNTSFKTNPSNSINFSIADNIEYHKTISNDHSRKQSRIKKKISENTVLLNELLPCTKKHNGFFNYSNPHPANKNSIASFKNISSNSTNPNRKPYLCSKNNFQTTQKKLYTVNSNSIHKLLKS